MKNAMKGHYRMTVGDIFETLGSSEVDSSYVNLKALHTKVLGFS